MRLVALVGDLMDRSRLTNAFPELEFARDSADCAGADVVIVDLARHGPAITDLRTVAPTARIVAFGPHVDGDAAERARTDGADDVVARSRFFRDPARVVHGTTG